MNKFFNKVKSFYNTDTGKLVLYSAISIVTAVITAKFIDKKKGE